MTEVVAMVGRLFAAVFVAGSAGVVLATLGPHPGELVATFRSPQAWVGLHGADQAVLLVAAAVGWAVLGWLVLGIGVTAAAELPGVAGRGAGLLAHVVLPAALRQGVAVALGVGLVTAGAGVATASPVDPGPGVNVDWPQQPSPPRPPPVDPPVTPPPTAPVDPAPGRGEPVNGVVVVRTGDSLWAIAAERLGPQATDADVMAAVGRWYAANRPLIGPDPDLIHPGQRLTPPGGTS